MFRILLSLLCKFQENFYVFRHQLYELSVVLLAVDFNDFRDA